MICANSFESLTDCRTRRAELVHALIEDAVEVLDSRVTVWLRCSDAAFSKRGHHVASRWFRRFLCANCFKMCLVNNPQPRSTTPSFINSSNTSSPSWLMAVKFLISTTNLRPPSSALALSRAVFSSAAHGAISLPSTTNRQWLGLSIVEIFSMRFLGAGVRARRLPNSQGRKLNDFLEPSQTSCVKGLKSSRHVRHRPLKGWTERTTREPPGLCGPGQIRGGTSRKVGYA
jgi:hypothetical protein